MPRSDDTRSPVLVRDMMADRLLNLDEARAERRFLVCLIAAFLFIRLLWLYRVHGGFDGFLSAAEATHVALSVAQDGILGDAYFRGQGPTAHLMPLNPLIAGGVLWLFGPWGSAAHLVLLAWSLGQVLCGYLLVRLIFIRLGADRVAVRWGSALLLLLAPFVPQETIDFRYWEGAGALCLVALNMLFMLGIDARRRLGAHDYILVPPLFAITFFVSPPSGLAIGSCWAIVALSRLAIGENVALAGATLAAVALTITPWALRNADVLGEPILLRSNAGLELAIANYPQALENQDRAAAFQRRIMAIHPAANAAAANQVRSSGEAAYARSLGRTTWRWIQSDPAGFAQLWLRHVSEMIAPRPWQIYFTGWEGARTARAWTISIVQLVGLAGLLIGLRSGHRGYRLLACYLAMMVMTFGVFQPMPRYVFAIYPFLAFLAVQAVVWSCRRLPRPVRLTRPA